MTSRFQTGKLGRWLWAAAAAAVCSAGMAHTAYAAPGGDLVYVDGNVLKGWAWDSDSPDSAVKVKIYGYADGSETPLHLGTVTADMYRDGLKEKIGSSNHGFACAMEWDRYKGKSFRLEAAVVADGTEHSLGDVLYYDKNGTEGASGPGAPAADDSSGGSAQKGQSLGMFITTAYCGCSSCSGGHGTTYSGTVPKENHTVSADLDIYPIGTKLMIGDTVYTVEDKGSSVVGNKVDIYFDTHQEAVAYGRKEVEAFAVAQ